MNVEIIKSRTSRNSILNSAKSCFSRNGLHKTTVQQIALSAEVSVGQIYRHFKNKDEIIKSVIEEKGENLIRYSKELKEGLDFEKIDILNVFQKLTSYSIQECDGAISFDIFAESFRNENVANLLATISVKYRDFLRYFIFSVNPHLDIENAVAAEEWVLACQFGFSHRQFSRSSLSTEDTARRVALYIVEGLRAL